MEIESQSQFGETKIWFGTELLSFMALIFWTQRFNFQTICDTVVYYVRHGIIMVNFTLG
jgi:hypothetical protein